MDWKALIDIGLGGAALLMAKKLQVAVALLTELVKGHDVILQAHDTRMTKIEAVRDERLRIAERA